MKTNKSLLAVLAVTIIFSLWLASTNAYGWNWQGAWNGQGQWMWNGQGTWNWQGQWTGQWQGTGKASSEHNAWDMLVNIPKQDVDSTEIDLLEKQYEEEMMANELYLSFYEKYWLETFKNIAESEAQHMEAVKALLDRYNIEIPTNYEHIQSLYEDLKEKWDKSLQDALEVWVRIEIVDIDDIITAITSTDNDDIQIVFTNIGWGSYNHMRGFVKALANNNFTIDIDYSDYLSESDVNTKGSIKGKLAEKLEAQWVDLPEQVSSTEMVKKTEETTSSQWDTQSNNNSVKNQYKEKYADVVSKMSDDKLYTLIEKIDALSAIINDWNYSSVIKQKYNPLLLWLRELALENFDGDSIDVEALFQ